jgi:hypothetical protein
LRENFHVPARPAGARDSANQISGAKRLSICARISLASHGRLMVRSDCGFLMPARSRELMRPKQSSAATFQLKHFQEKHALGLIGGGIRFQFENATNAKMLERVLFAASVKPLSPCQLPQIGQATSRRNPNQIPWQRLHQCPVA